MSSDSRCSSSAFLFKRRWSSLSSCLLILISLSASCFKSRASSLAWRTPSFFICSASFMAFSIICLPCKAMFFWFSSTNFFLSTTPAAMPIASAAKSRSRTVPLYSIIFHPLHYIKRPPWNQLVPVVELRKAGMRRATVYQKFYCRWAGVTDKCMVRRSAIAAACIVWLKTTNFLYHNSPTWQWTVFSRSGENQIKTWQKAACLRIHSF